ncbi:MAG: hypothetical protein AAB947_01150, partial [Patescibacteria group bacterium]
MEMSRKFIILEPGQCPYEYDDGNVLVFGFTPSSWIQLPKSYTHFGVVTSGEIKLSYEYRERHLVAGDFFSVVGPAVINSSGLGLINSARSYRGMNVFGGPLEEKGRLRYINGCTATLLIPPVRSGDPCLNHLHLPKGIKQTPHTHPSVRTGIVFRGGGECLVPKEDKVVPLVEGCVFVIEPETVHSFNTATDSMNVIAFHPDSDVGMTDEDGSYAISVVDSGGRRFHP